MRGIGWTLAVVMATSAVPAAAMDITFRGPSRTSPQLKRDLLTNITGYSKATWQCAFPFTVDTSIVPAGYVPKATMFRIASPERVYERWWVNLCGKKRLFVVGYWPSPRGGADYKVMPSPNGQLP